MVVVGTGVGVSESAPGQFPRAIQPRSGEANKGRKRNNAATARLHTVSWDAKTAKTAKTSGVPPL